MLELVLELVLEGLVLLDTFFPVVDIFAVRQWPGNVADLDFRGVIKRCGALVVSTSPVDGLKEFLKNKERADFFTTDEGNLAKKATPFFRLWCIVELVAAIVLLVYSPLKTASKSSQSVLKNVLLR